MKMKRVVVTGISLATPIGNIKSRQDIPGFTAGLFGGKVGIVTDQTFEAMGFKAPYSGCVSDLEEWKDEILPPDDGEFKVTRKFMGKGDTLALALLPSVSAVKDAGLLELIRDNAEVSSQTAIFVGSGGPSTLDQVEAGAILKEFGSARKIGPFSVPPTMSSGPSAIVATYLGARGGAISLTSACATGTHNIGHAYQQIAFGVRTIAVAGGADDSHVTKAAGFEAMRKALYGGDLPPEKSSRPFDRDRNGFIDTPGGAVVVLEELEYAQARGAHIYAEVVGFAYTSDGAGMTTPNGEGAKRCMIEALDSAGNPKIDYLNAHGTSTPQGDLVETKAANSVFGDNKPYMNSTKSQTGHFLGGSGSAEAVFTVLSTKEGKIGAQVNLDNLDPEIAKDGWEPYIPTETISVPIEYAMSNSFGFGGTNGTLVFRRWDG